MTRSAREVVELYNQVVWNERDVDGRITEICNCGYTQGVWE